MKKSLVSLLTVGVLLAPSALVFAEEGLDPEVDNKTSEQDYFENSPKSWDDDRLDIQEIVSTKAIPYNTLENPTAELAEGVRQVEVVGVEGVETTVIETAYWNNGEVAWDIVGGPIRSTTTITTEKVDEVVLVGTGIMDKEVARRYEEIPFKTEFVEDPELPIGEEKVSQEGVNGKIEYTTVYETKDGLRTGEILESEHETDRVEPTTKIIKQGTKEVADEFVVTATLVDEEGNALTGEVLTITGEDVEQELTTDENGAVTFSVPNGTYTVAFGINSKTVVVEDEDISVELVAGPKEVTPDPEFYIGVVRNNFPQFDAEGNEYDVEDLADFVIITITDKDGKFVAEIEYNKADQTTRIVSIPSTPLKPAKPIEETTEEETTEVVTDNGATPVQVIRSTSTESSRAELPETGELGGGLTVLASALSALGGLGLFFKKRK